MNSNACRFFSLLSFVCHLTFVFKKQFSSLKSDFDNNLESEIDWFFCGETENGNEYFQPHYILLKYVLYFDLLRDFCCHYFQFSPFGTRSFLCGFFVFASFRSIVWKLKFYGKTQTNGERLLGISALTTFVFYLEMKFIFISLFHRHLIFNTQKLQSVISLTPPYVYSFVLGVFFSLFVHLLGFISITNRLQRLFK